MSDLKNIPLLNWIQAISFLFKKDFFTNKNFQDAKAMIAQEKNKSCDTITKEETVRKILIDHGYGMDKAIKNKPVKTWLYDSMTFLTKNPCIIGFLISEDNDNWFSIRSEDKITWLWQTSDTEHDMVYKQDIINKMLTIKGNVYLIWKMWIPLYRWIKKKRPFYIRGADTESDIRWEYEPTSCFLPQKMNYKGKNKKILKTMNKWSGTILMSNRKELVLCSPSSTGWETETIMEFDGVPFNTQTTRLASLANDQILNFCNKYPHKSNEIMAHVAHALTSICDKFKINVPHKSLTAFQLEESDEEKIREYDKVLENMEFDAEETI
tara:strand:+ start:616 stop:1587 length:972 start_codon:yes stop_codon:yes gene_type:complete